MILEYRGETAAGRALLSEAIEALSALPPSRELARALATSAGTFLVAGNYPEVVVEADRTIELADRVGEPAASARAHGFRGYARAIRGDMGGIDEQRESLATLSALGLGRSAAIAANNLGSCLSHVESAQAGLRVLREGVSFAQARGLREMVMALNSSVFTVLFEIGEWDELLRLGADVVREAREQGSGFDEVFAEADRALVMACRDGPRAIPFCDSILERARPIEDVPLVLQALLAAATAHDAAADREAVRALVREALEATRAEVVVRAPELPALVRLAVSAATWDWPRRRWPVRRISSWSASASPAWRPRRSSTRPGAMPPLVSNGTIRRPGGGSNTGTRSNVPTRSSGRGGASCGSAGMKMDNAASMPLPGSSNGSARGRRWRRSGR